MSKRHIVFLKKSSSWKISDKEEIWNNVKEVWDQYPSPAISRGHILAYRIMQKYLFMDRGNDYLDNVLHSNFRQDFINTDDGAALLEYIFNSNNYGY